MRTNSFAYMAGFILLIFVAVLAVVNFLNLDRTSVYSVKSMLSSTFRNYADTYVETDSGRVTDTERDNVTTSEGISYTLLRAVWMDEKVLFDKTFLWGDKNLVRKDGLYSWLYGEKGDGAYGVLVNQGGDNSASDANVNIALALIFAANRWNDESYLTYAKDLIDSIWKHEVVFIAGEYYLAANNLEKMSGDKVLINPSYLEPHAFKIFALVDTRHPWEELVDSSYSILEKSTESIDLNGVRGKLPPDWLTIDRITGEIIPTDFRDASHDYSYDALRIPWNIAMDYEWFKDPRALKYLKSLTALSLSWEKDNKIYSVYSHDGVAKTETEIPAMYGGSIGYFLFTDPITAEIVYRAKLISNFSQDTNGWKKKLSYYDDNWAWFGIALYNHLLPNLAIKVEPI